MVELLYRIRPALGLVGLTLLFAGLAVAIGLSAVVGFALVGAAGLVLALVQPQFLAHLRSQQARRRAPRNGHLPGTDAHDVDLPSQKG